MKSIRNSLWVPVLGCRDKVSRAQADQSECPARVSERVSEVVSSDSGVSGRLSKVVSKSSVHLFRRLAKVSK